jgi:hypothetical protein
LFQSACEGNSPDSLNCGKSVINGVLYETTESLKVTPLISASSHWPGSGQDIS